MTLEMNNPWKIPTQTEPSVRVFRTETRLTVYRSP